MAEKQKVEQQIPAMYGTFRLKGRVDKIDTTNYDSETSTKRKRRAITLIMRTSKDNTVSVPLSAIAQDSVYFVKRDENGKEEERKIIPWDERNTTPLPEGFYPMSRIMVGVEQEIDENGQEKNKSQFKILYDAIEDIYNFVKVGDELFIRGDVTVESYENRRGETVSTVRLNPNQISMRNKNDKLDFDDPNFAEDNSITQPLIIQDVEIDEDNEKAAVNGLVIGRKREGTIEIEIEGKDNLMFAKTLKNLSVENPYGAITLQARISNEGSVGPQKVWDDVFNTWVVPKTRQGGFRTRYVYIAMVAESYDNVTYTEENVAEFRNTFCRGKQEFGSNTAEATTNTTTTRGSEDIWGSI